MSKRIKEMVISEIGRQLPEVVDMLVVDSSRLDAISTNKWRLSLRESNISVLYVKNSLAKKALNQAGISSLDSLLQGPTTLVWGGEDIVALSKEIAKWAKELKELEIKGGTVEGTCLTAADVDELSKSPSRLELIGQIAGLALSPGGQIASLLIAPGGTLAGQIKALSEGESEEQPEEQPEEAAIS